MMELPTNLRNDLALVMHREIIEAVPFLQDKNEYFIAFTTPLMKAIKF